MLVSKIEEVIGYQLIQRKNNKKRYFSNHCPFCGENGKKNFGYNEKLKVGKSFCCGASFKDLSWLKILIQDRLYSRIRLIYDDQLIKTYERKRDHIIWLLEENISDKLSSIVKSEEHEELPF